MEEVISYLTKNQMELDAKIQGSDPLRKLQQLGQRELSIAYDNLIALLTQREAEIEKVLAKQVEHFGLTERVLQTGKNYARELDNVQPTTDKHVKDRQNVEEVIGVGQQITNIINSKNMTG